jgi:chorismate mutase
VALKERVDPNAKIKTPEQAIAAGAQALGREPVIEASLIFQDGRTRLGTIDTGPSPRRLLNRAGGERASFFPGKPAIAPAAAKTMVRPPISGINMGTDAADAPPSLDEVRWRLDAIDGELLKLLDERAGLASSVAAAKRAAGDTGFGLRPGREALIVRKLLATPRKAANDALVIRIWREVMSDNLARQGPYHLSVWGGNNPPAPSS